ncbi:MAG: hypothetical protein ABSG75_10980 [Syntrophales bacterium]|jgi:hypothetical protein
MRASIVSAVISGSRGLFGTVVDHEKGVCRRETADRSSAVHSLIDFAVRSEDKAGCMYVTLRIVEKGPCCSGERPRIKSIGNREGQFFSLYGFLGIFETIR